MNFRKPLGSIAIAIISLSHLSMVENPLNDFYGILDHKDYSLEQQQVLPALHSIKGEVPSWESYNSWICFPASSVGKVECRDHNSDKSWDLIDSNERDDIGFYTVMDLSYEGQGYRLESPDWLDSERCLQKVNEIESLIRGQIGFCAFAARLPSEDWFGAKNEDEYYTWVVYGIKTPAGSVMAPIYDLESDEDEDEDGDF